MSGEMVRAGDCLPDYAPAAECAVEALTIWPQGRWEKARGYLFEADGLIVTSAFLVADPARGRLFADQSYGGIAAWLPMRPRITGDGFVLETQPETLPGRTLVIGGPIDGVWYHWLFNWAPRLLLAGRLRPDLLADPATRIAVHPRALEQPYRGILDGLGVAAERCVALDPARDYRLERAAIVSFVDQAQLWPALVEEMAGTLLHGLGVAQAAGRRRVYCSRQALPCARRRVGNFDALEPMLRAKGFDIVDLALLSAREQAALFREAELVVGAHGSDLTNILFCRPGTRVIVFEHEYSVLHGQHRGLQFLAGLMDLDYVCLRTAPWRPGGGTPPSTAAWLAEDYLVDVAALAALVEGGPPPEVPIGVMPPRPAG